MNRFLFLIFSSVIGTMTVQAQNGGLEKRLAQGLKLYPEAGHEW